MTVRLDYGAAGSDDLFICVHSYALGLCIDMSKVLVQLFNAFKFKFVITGAVESASLSSA